MEGITQGKEIVVPGHAEGRQTRTATLKQTGSTVWGNTMGEQNVICKSMRFHRPTPATEIAQKDQRGRQWTHIRSSL